MGYAVAAYGLVIGSLVWYGWHIQRQRRDLQRSLESDRTAESDT